ncbi:hypothetical protein LMG23994_01628 [Cupriavidus pinatubonensis]|uniref:Uncharacterized protein n=1 Tax=Cupriavidus pinatubonensis TaxID=248026 RepID=A0ABM8WQP6_9BURK|nr:hypothetical protein LMG23994_01628 [Cupriavidus pinatubonensis]
MEGVEVGTADVIEDGVERTAGGQGRQGVVQFREPTPDDN